MMVQNIQVSFEMHGKILIRKRGGLHRLELLSTHAFVSSFHAAAFFQGMKVC